MKNLNSEWRGRADHRIRTLKNDFHHLPGGIETQAKAENAEYGIMKVSGTIDWEQIPALSVGNILWTDDTGIRAQGQLCYDDENLYVRLSAAEKEIRAENTEPLSPVFEDSCLEFFFMLDGAGNYFNFEINPNGCLLIKFGTDRHNRVDIVRQDAAGYFDIRTNRTADGWEVYYKIPLRFIQLFYPGYHFEGSLRANVYKCGDKTMNVHYLSWAPIGLPSPDFHCPEFFGWMNFS